MSRFSQGIGSANLPGVPSRMRVYWPDDLSSNSAGSFASKYGPQPNSSINQVSSGGSLTASIVYAGVECEEQIVTLLNTYQWLKLNHAVSWFTERVGGTLVDEYSCFSLRATLSWDAITTPSISDIGLAIFAGTANNLLQAAIPPNSGVVFGPTDLTHIALRGAVGGVQTVNQVVAAGLTPTLTGWNTFEIRCISGSPNTDPFIYGLINGQVVTTKVPWTAAAGLLPGNGDQATHGYLFSVGVANPAGTANTVHQYIREICWTAAGNESDLT